MMYNRYITNQAIGQTFQKDRKRYERKSKMSNVTREMKEGVNKRDKDQSRREE